MKIQTQHHDSLSRIAKMIEGSRVCMLTTVGDDGALVSRPMGALEMDAEGNFWFLTSDASGKAHQTSRVNLAFSNEGDAKYVSVSGSAQVVRDRARIEELWSPMARPWFPGGKDAPDLVALKVETQVAEYWDSNSSAMVRALAMAASVVAGRPVGLGDHGVVGQGGGRAEIPPR